MNHRTSLALTTLCALGLLAACGGRYQTLRETDDDTVSGGSGSGGRTGVGQAGSASSGAGSSSAGSNNAGANNAGASSAGAGSAGFGNAGSGGASCANVKCAAVDCADGATPTWVPGACCPTCTLCPPCPLIKCAAGTRPQKLPGSCCSTCVDDGGAACEMGRKSYAEQRAAVLDKYQYGCASNSECTVIAPRNSCEQGCSYAAVWYGVADSFDTNLSSAADKYCASCQQGPIPPCAAPTAPRCVNGSCTL